MINGNGLQIPGGGGGGIPGVTGQPPIGPPAPTPPRGPPAPPPVPGPPRYFHSYAILIFTHSVVQSTISEVGPPISPIIRPGAPGSGTCIERPPPPQPCPPGPPGPPGPVGPPGDNGDDGADGMPGMDQEVCH